MEGTIVSVLRAAASGAGRSTASTLVEVARSAADAAAEALDQTTTQLPALRRAGVVDAGGRGLLVLLDTFVEVLSGEAPERREYAPRDGAAVDTGGLEVTTAVPSRGSGRRRPEAPADHEGPRFEVMYSLRHSEESRVDELRGTLRELGDSESLKEGTARCPLGGADDIDRLRCCTRRGTLSSALAVVQRLGRYPGLLPLRWIWFSARFHSITRPTLHNPIAPSPQHPPRIPTQRLSKQSHFLEPMVRYPIVS